MTLPMRAYPLIVIILLRVLSALPFAIYYSSLQLYLLNTNFPRDTSISLVGSVLALSFGSSLIGGVLANRYISYRAFFIFCLICQAIGCLTFTTLSHNTILWFSSFFLLGSAGITVSLNMMITQRYEAHDQGRDKAFFWLYMSLNLGYLIGYSLSGYYGNFDDYEKIPFFVGICSIVAIFLCYLNWSQIDKARQTYSKYTACSTIFILTALFIVIRLLLQFPILTNNSIIAAWIFFSVIMFYILRKNYVNQQKDIIAFYILLLAALVFWSVYFLAPMALIIFIKHNVDLKAFNIPIAPQWIQNINTLIIIAGTIFLGSKSEKKSSNTKKITKQFSLGLFLMGIGFGILVLGIMLTSTSSKVALVWIVVSYILQSLGELLIGPIGYALVGRLIPKPHHSIMMGIWVTLLGVAGAVSSKLSSMAPYANNNYFLIQYEYFFSYISLIAIIAACIVFAASYKVINPKLISQPFVDIQ